MRIKALLNGEHVEWDVSPGDRLVDILRSHGYMGTKYGCGTGECGACVVLLDGEPVNSCLVLAPKAEGRDIVTVEGLGTNLKPHILQEEFAKNGAVQCGYCTPGMILSAYTLLKRNPDPSREDILRTLDGNLCRCTGYVKIVEAVLTSAKRMREGCDEEQD